MFTPFPPMSVRTFAKVNVSSVTRQVSHYSRRPAKEVAPYDFASPLDRDLKVFGRLEIFGAIVSACTRLFL